MDIHAECIEAIDWIKAAGIRMLELSGKPEHEKAKVDFKKPDWPTMTRPSACW